MPFSFFHEYFPEVAKAETRSLTVTSESPLPLPPGEYGFVEMYCNEPKCDCRRVFLYVVSSSKEDVEAVINYGWETSSFYRKWLHSKDPQEIAELKGPSLNLGSPQSSLAPKLLKFVQNVLLQDAAYVERIKKHYQMFREKVDKSAHSQKKRKAWKLTRKTQGFGEKTN